MVQKKKSRLSRVKAKPAAVMTVDAQAPQPKRRGRPRAYEPDVALARALDVFWKDGFAATSLDDLSAATGMNRPSLYGAFGDKRELYIKSYQSYRDRARVRMGEVFSADLPLRSMLSRIYSIALDMYLSGEDGPRGCFTVMTATSEAVFDPDIRKLVVMGLVEMDRFFALLFKAAQAQGELPKTANPEALAQLASATIHTIAIRARAQVPRKELEGIVEGAIDLMCGPLKAKQT